MAKKQGGDNLLPLPFTTFGELAALGYTVKDTPQGTVVHR